MSNIIVGLDIGTTKIACFIGQATPDGKLKILGYGKTDSIGVERGVVRNINLTSESIIKAVNEASNQANVQVEEVYVGIAGQHIKSMQNQGSIMIPPDHATITEGDLNRLIEEQKQMLLPPGEVIIHVIPQDYSIDNVPLSPEVSPVGVPGKCLSAQFHIVTSNADNLNNIKLAVVQANLRIKRVVLEPIASSYAVLNDLDRDAGVALVDIGGGTTDIAIFSQGIIRHTTVIPLAGNVITEDIRKGCSILKNQAESLKVKFGSALPALESADDIISIPGVRNQPSREISMKTLAGIVKARVQMILEQVAYEIDQSGYNGQLIAGIVLTGGGAKMKHISELSELITTTHTRIGTPDEHLAEASEDLAHPMFATAVGLVLYGIEYEAGHSNEEEEEKTEESTVSGSGTSPEDIFKGLDEIPDKPVVAEVPAAPEPKKKPKRRGGLDFVNKMLNNFFTENVDSE